MDTIFRQLSGWPIIQPRTRLQQKRARRHIFLDINDDTEEQQLEFGGNVKNKEHVNRIDVVGKRVPRMADRYYKEVRKQSDETSWSDAIGTLHVERPETIEERETESVFIQLN